MEHRFLGRSGFSVPALCFGTATFGGTGFLKHWGALDAEEATKLVDLCLNSGVNFFDSADVYSNGMAEEILGSAIKGRRNEVLLATKCGFRSGPDANQVGASRANIIASVERSLKRLGADHVDLFQLHAFDAMTPAEEVMATFDTLIRAGKVRYAGVSNYSGWHLMKSLAVSDRYGYPRFVCHQAYYSLIGRDYEWELMPLALNQGLGTIVWSPLGWGRLTGKIRRSAPPPSVSRLPATAEYGPPTPDELLFRVVDALDAVAAETGKAVPQIAINWLLQRPSVSSVIIGARNVEQLRQNLDSSGWTLDPQHVALLDAASKVVKPYPYWHQAGYERNPAPV